MPINRYLFLFSIIFFYFIFPLIFFKYSKLYGEFKFIYNDLLNINYLVFLFSIIFIFIFIFIKFSKLINTERSNEEISKNKIFYQILKFFLLISLIFILSDIIKVLIFWYENYENLSRDTRGEIYRNILNKRLTYIKIAMIISIFLYKSEKILSLIGITSIICLDLLTLSRFNISILIILFFLNNLKINKKKIILATLLILILFSYRPIFQYFSIFINDQSTYEHDFRELLVYYTVNAPGEFFAVFATLLLYTNNLVNLIQVFLKLSDFPTLLKFYISDNYNYFLKSFLYISNTQIYNYWDHHIVPNKWANHGATFIISYFPLLYLYYYVLKKITFLFNKFEIDINFLRIIILYILSMSFRGNIIHEIGFSIKLILLLILTKILIQTILNKFSKKNFH